MQDPNARKRWQALLEDLGIAPESEEANATAQPPTPPPLTESEPSAPPQAEPPAEGFEEVVVEATEVTISELERVEDGPAQSAVEEAPTGKGRRRRGESAKDEGRSAPPSTERPAEGSSSGRRKRRRTRSAGAETEEPVLERESAGLESTGALAEGQSEAESMVPPPLPVEASLSEEPLNEAGSEVDLGGQEIPEEVELPISEETELPAAEEGEPEAETPSPGRRRRRRRGRKAETEMAAPAPPPEPPAEEEEEESEEAVVAEVGGEEPFEDDEDDFEDLTNLNVPSWAELVSGLYRPPDR